MREPAESKSEIKMLTEVCVNLGANRTQADTMAKQLLKRADQLADERGIAREEALRQLLELVVAGREGRSETPIRPKGEE